MSVFRDRRIWCLVAWAVCLGNAADRMNYARHAFDNTSRVPADRHRADGNSGHAQIDFAGSWVLGRLLVTGHGRDLYDRNRQRAVVRAAYPRSASSPWVRRDSFPKAKGIVPYSDDDPRHDDDWILFWFMGSDPPAWQRLGGQLAAGFTADPWAGLAAVPLSQLEPKDVSEANAKSVGGPLYPPVAAFLYAPFALTDDPKSGYAAFQWVNLLAVFVAGWGVRCLTGGRVWWPWATAAILLFPGFRPGLALAQNSAVTLAILTTGWVLNQRGRLALGGAVWGLLAFKPVWAVAFLLFALLMRQWRFAAAVCATGAALCLLTLPFVGVESWFDWLAVGREASETYSTNRNWIFLSRDLFGLPRRADLADRFHVGWLLYAAVFATTVFVGRRRPGLAALGAYLLCYRFMYYDVLLAAFPFAILLAELRSRQEILRSPAVWALIALLIWDVVFAPLRLEWELASGLFIGTGERYPVDTLILLALFAVLTVQQHRQSGPGVGLSDQ